MPFKPAAPERPGRFPSEQRYYVDDLHGMRPRAVDPTVHAVHVVEVLQAYSSRLACSSNNLGGRCPSQLDLM